MLVQITEVAAKFLNVGEIIDRGGVMMKVVGRPIPCPYTIGRVQIVVEDLEHNVGKLYPCSLNPYLMVPTYDEV